MIEKEVWGRIIKDHLEHRAEVIERDVTVKFPKTPRAISIIGPRRAGKTYLMFQLINWLTSGGLPREKTVYVNFEDPRLVGAELKDLLTFLDVYYEMFPENVRGECHFFLDEVQNVPDWERFVRFLLDRNQRVVVSGSSSKLLSKEIATSLRGRSLSVRVYPFSFREVLRANGLKVERFYSTYEKAKINKLLREYLHWGGYPEVVLNPHLRAEILREIIDLTIYRDIVERWGAENLKALRLLLRMLAFSSHLSASKAYRNLKSLGIGVGKATVANYIEYFSDSMILHPLRPYVKSYKLQERMGFKPYLVDNGLLKVMGVEDEGRLLENLVFTELLKRGYEPNGELFYYVTRNGREVDFVIKGRELIQVTAELHEKNRERELRALIEAGRELGIGKLTIVTLEQDDVVKTAGKEVKVTSLKKWLLGL
ncbi:MAG: ATP-binding protein [Thermococcus sp.]|nr:ATP-binding protein [Thermococcus sp.]